jgi:endoglucanase
MLAPTASSAAPADEHFYVPKANHDAVEQIAELTSQGRKDEAALIRATIQTPQAVWIESNSPKQAEQQVRQVTRQAAGKGTVPVLVAYNIPFRDCAQYSAGGATSLEEYVAWIDGVAAGIGDREAVVILEPDGLGIIPWYTTINGQLEWCQPAEADPETAAAERFTMLNHAVDALKALPNTSVYLDGTHSAWLGVGDAADRLIQAGVTRADGFFLNASNYQLTERQLKYGDWISQCIHLDQNSWYQRDWCASQYYPADPSDFSTWHLSDAAYAQAYEDTGLTRDPDAMPHYVIDTSRNGLGPWSPPEGAYPDPQDWCNPPDRGLGERPTTATGSDLADAYVWIKIPGESDGQCLRGTAGPEDPARGTIDPPAGHWFPEQALELATLAEPPLAPATNHGRG